MNVNEEKILGLLMSSSSQITCKTIANSLDISERTVRYVIKSLKDMGYQITSNQDGYFLVQDNNKKLDISIDEDSNDRLINLSKEIIFSKNGIDVFDLADKMFISYSTMEKDLKKLKSNLIRYDLNLKRENGLLYIEGSEKNKRKYISKVLLSNHRAMLSPAIVQMCGVLNISYDYICSIIEKNLNKNKLYASDYGKKSIIIHILINLSRISISGYILDKRLYEEQNHANHEYICAQEIYNSLKDKINININDYEIEQLAFIIAAKTTNMNVEDKIIDINNSLDNDITRFVKRIIKQINDIYYIDLNDKDFLNFFTMHLTNALFRAKHNVFAANPLYKSIMVQNALIYDISVFIAQEIRRVFHYSFNQEEITFIALHVGAVIEKKEEERKILKTALLINEYYNYQRTQEALVSINKKLHDKLELVTITNNIKTLNLNEYDFIIDTTYSLINISIPKINISPIINQKSIGQIIDFANKLEQENKRKKLKKKFISFFDSSLFEKNHYEKTPEDMIRYLSKKFIDIGIASDDFTESVLDRESIAPTSFDNLIAIPHSITSQTTKNCGSVIINDESMQWGFFQVNIIILIGVCNDNRMDFKAIYNGILDSINDAQKVNKLIKSTSLDEFIDNLL